MLLRNDPLRVQNSPIALLAYLLQIGLERFDGVAVSLMTLRYQGSVWWVRARLATVIDTSGLSLATVADQITSGGIDFAIEQAWHRRLPATGPADTTTRQPNL